MCNVPRPGGHWGLQWIWFALFLCAPLLYLVRSRVLQFLWVLIATILQILFVYLVEVFFIGLNPYSCSFKFMVWQGICVAYDLIEVQKVDIRLSSLFSKVITNCSLKKWRHSEHSDALSSAVRRYKPISIRIFALMSVGLLLVYFRWRIMGSKPPSFQLVDNPASFADSFWTRVGIMKSTCLPSMVVLVLSCLFFVQVLTYNYIYAMNVWLLLCPEWLCFDWSMGCIPLVQRFTDFRIFAIVVFWTSLLSFLCRGMILNDKVARFV